MNKSLTYIVIAIAVAGVVAVLVYSNKKPMEPSGTPRACTMEAKICPDGSAVGRVGPNCEFAPCP